MERVGREEWAKRVQRWQDSGLTAREFALETGVTESSLSFWKWRLKKDAEAERASKPTKPTKRARQRPTRPIRFVELDSGLAAAPRAESQLVLTIGSRYTVRLGSDFDAAVLQRLLDIVERRT
jgi:transposase